MTREEAREILTHNWTRVDNPNYSESELDEAFFMAIEALSEPKTIIGIDIPYGSDKGIATIFKGNEKMVLEEVKEIMAVVRCKDCRHRDLFSCPLADNDFQKDEDFCSWGERREPSK